MAGRKKKQAQQQTHHRGHGGYREKCLLPQAIPTGSYKRKGRSSISSVSSVTNHSVGNFDSTFAAHPEMALYIPLIGGTGGNVGTQSSAIIVQGLANSSLDAKNTFKQVTKEAVVALINATIISLLVYTYNFIRFGATATVTYSVSISLFAVVMFASIFGTLVPMTLEKLKIDPAIATGPFIAITNDIIGMMLYMGITVLLS